MQITKKVFSVALTALLVLSIFAIAAPALAITATPTLTYPTGTTAANVIVGTAIGVSGTDGAPGALTSVYWDNVGHLLNSSYNSGAGGYQVNIVVPNDVAGVHYLIVTDSSGTATAAVLVNPSITLSPTSGIPGDVVAITGAGFAANSNTTINFSNSSGTTIYNKNLVAVNSTATGDIAVSFTVPAVDYGVYTVNATDASGSNFNNATSTFTVGASTIISPSKGPTGTVVSITGRGFSKIAGLQINITVGGVPAVEVAPITTLADGTISGQFVVPTVSAKGLFAVDVNDANYTATNSAFTVTGLPGIVVSPTSGAPGAPVTISGANYTAISGTAVTILFGTTPDGTTTVATLSTDATGSFTGTFNVPSLPTSTSAYYVNASDTYTLNSTTTFYIAITALYVSPNSGPTGSTATLTGFGFGTTSGTTFNVTIGTYLVTPSSNLVTALKAGTATIVVPTLPAGTYTVTATDNMGLTASATFTVTATSAVTVTPSTTPLGVGTKVMATGFTRTATTAITFTLTNATAAFKFDLTPYLTAATGFTTGELNGTGVYIATLLIPTTGTGLSLGTYTLNCSDFNGLYANTTFTIGAATVVVASRSTQYLQGQTVSFTVESTFADNTAVIKVSDPTGLIYAAIDLTNWITMPATGLVVVPSSSAQFTLTSDAPVGQYNWTTTVSGTPVSGNFMVLSSQAVSNVTNTDLNQTLTNLFNDLNSKITAINGNIATIQTSMGTVTASVNSLSATITGVSNGFATLQTSLGTVTTSLSSLDAVLGQVANDTATLKTSVGDVTTSLNALGANVTSIQGNVATIQTDVGTLTGTITSVNSGVATIQTGIGTLQTDIGNLQTSVGSMQSNVSSAKSSTDNLTPLIIVAIVLALIAAIAAIASIVLMRRKIAG